MTTRGRPKPVRKTGNTRPVVVGGICTPSAAARVGATSCCTAGVEYLPVFTAAPANISGIATSYGHGEPCMNATSARVMKSPSRGTIRSWPVRPGKYARANISKKRCRVARVVASDGAARWIPGTPVPIDRLTCWLDTVQVIATRVRAIAIRDPTLRMRALLADYRLFSSALILVTSTRILQAPCNGLVLESWPSCSATFRAGVGKLEVTDRRQSAERNKNLFNYSRGARARLHLRSLFTFVGASHVRSRHQCREIFYESACEPCIRAIQRA